ncbi:MAG: hypothetical protein ACK459_03290 [Akkermansiaceae bacterium]|jgi:hypothetical protein
MLMKTAVLFILCLALSLASQAQIKKDKESLLESEPGVVYLNQIFDKPVKLNVIEQAQVFSDKDGSHRLGFLKADQVVELEGMTEKAYRVRGQGTKNGIAGWVSPKAFSHSDPEFIGKLKKIYERQIAVNEIIKNKGLAIGMTPKEVELSRGKPTKTTIRVTPTGESGSWEYINFEEIKHYITKVDPVTGQAYRQFSHTTREETGKTTVEFKDGAVSALEEMEDKGPGNTKIIIPPVVVGW